MHIRERPADHTFTLRYAQPREYHFCLDSVLLPKLIADLTRLSLPYGASVMDMGAGCGVLGLEFLFYRSDLRKLVFLEKQKIFEPFLHENRRRAEAALQLLTQLELRIHDVRNLCASEAGMYDLLLVNPPYYFVDEGSTPLDETKARCHFFLDTSPEDFIRAIEFYLKPGGEAFVLVKKPERWRKAVMASVLKAEVVASIRGTPVVRFHKH